MKKKIGCIFLFCLELFVRTHLFDIEMKENEEINRDDPIILTPHRILLIVLQQ